MTTPGTSFVLRFADGLRDEADLYRRRGMDHLATMTESLADDLLAAWREYWEEDLTVAEAAEWSGYSEEHLRDRVRQGTLPDPRPEGSQGRITIRRGDLTPKPGPSSHKELEVDAAIEARAEAFAERMVEADQEISIP